MSKLEESKQYLGSTFTNSNYEIVLCEDIGIPRELLSWLIEQAEQLKSVKELVDDERITKAETVDKISKIVNAHFE